MVISENVMFTDHKTQKESYFMYVCHESFFFFFCFQNVSCGVVLLACCICKRRKMFTRIYLCVCVCVCVCVCACVRTYVRLAVTYMTAERGRSGGEITASCDSRK